jgi:hypothetical protein
MKAREREKEGEINTIRMNIYKLPSFNYEDKA